MVLKVVHDGTPSWEVMENCCMCGEFTRYWYRRKDVALCPNCAKKTKLCELPTKEEWCRRERFEREMKFKCWLEGKIR